MDQKPKNITNLNICSTLSFCSATHCKMIIVEAFGVDMHILQSLIAK
jgi:hypothetical protein